MRIECPSCHTAYEVPDDKITGKKVRCAHCGTDWVPPRPVEDALPTLDSATPAAPEAAPAPKPFLVVPDAALVPRPVTKATRKPVPHRALLITAWVVTVLLIAAIVAVAYNRREAVMNAWPPSQRLYAWVGLH